MAHLLRKHQHFRVDRALVNMEAEMVKNIKKTLALGLVLVFTAAAFAGCGKVNGTETALTVNGETLSTGTVNLYLRYQQAAYYNLMAAYGMVSAESGYWDNVSDPDTKETYGEAFLSDIKDYMVNMVVTRQHAEEYGCTLTEEQEASISEVAAKFISDNADVCEWIGVSQADAENLVSLITYQSNMYDYMIADVDTEISDDEAAQSTIYYIRLGLTAPSDYEGTAEEYTAERKEMAESILEELRDLKDPETDKMTEIAAAHDETLAAYSGSFGENDEVSAFDEAVLTAAGTLKDGELYDEVIETENALYLIKMEAVFDREATDSKKDSMVLTRQQERYSELLEQWSEEAEITEGSGFKKLKVTDAERYVSEGTVAG